MWIGEAVIHECIGRNTRARTYVHTPASSHTSVRFALVEMPRTPTISFHSQTLTCPLHLSVIQSTLPGVNHHPCWPAVTVCSQNEYWPPCCTPAWTPHPNHNALGLPPASLRPPSFYLSLSIHNTSIYGLPGPSLRVLYVPAPPALNAPTVQHPLILV